ncbi:hypothetical protein ACQ5SP_10660 [Rhodovulum sp. YNF3179]|uniref:hypothetical protein n=1 Tax=Rhodovulum sp. YNF3179 TaxID=3425127 RepID=UPI003D34EEBC
MTGRRDMAALGRLTAAASDAALAALRQAVAERRRLESEIDALDAETAQALGWAGDPAVRATIDRAWRARHAARRAELNTALAAALAHEAGARARAARDLGRQRVSERLAEAETAAFIRNRARRRAADGSQLS